MTLSSLAERFTATAPDIVGCGFTERPTDVTYDLDTWTKHALGVLDTLCLPEDRIQGIDKRTLLLRGRDDQVIPSHTSQRLVDLIDDSEEFAALVLQFLMR